MLKRLKSDRKGRKSKPLQRVLVVDDDPDAGRLVAQILRTHGLEVGELNDPHVALAGIASEPEALGAVVLSFTQGGASMCLKMLDTIRTHPDPRVSHQRVLIILDSPRQQIFTWQAGADEVFARPYHANFLVQRVQQVLDRPDDQRKSHRRDMLKSIEHGPSMEAAAMSSQQSDGGTGSS